MDSVRHGGLDLSFERLLFRLEPTHLRDHDVGARLIHGSKPLVLQIKTLRFLGIKSHAPRHTPPRAVRRSRSPPSPTPPWPHAPTMPAKRRENKNPATRTVNNMTISITTSTTTATEARRARFRLGNPRALKLPPHDLELILTRRVVHFIALSLERAHHL